jgi:hypothetical protein
MLSTDIERHIAIFFPGEKLSAQELSVCLQSLLGPEPLGDTLPRNFTADNFAIAMLGFEDYEASDLSP